MKPTSQPLLAYVQELCDINREIAHREAQLGTNIYPFLSPFFHSYSRVNAAARDAALSQLDLIVKVESEGRKREQDALVAKLRAEVLAGLKGQVRCRTSSLAVLMLTRMHVCAGGRHPQEEHCRHCCAGCQDRITMLPPMPALPALTCACV